MKKVFFTALCLLVASLAFTGASRNNPGMETDPLVFSDSSSFLSKADILFVADTQGVFGGNYYDQYQDAFEGLAYSVDTITTYDAGDGPDAETMGDYALVVWDCFDDWFGALTSNDVSNMTTYLDDGGYLWLMGQDINWVPPGGWTNFLSDYLGVSSVTNDIYWDVNPATANGISGTFTEDHTNVGLDAWLAFSDNNFYTDQVSVGDAFITYTSEASGYSPFDCAVAYDEGSFKSAFYTHHLECYTDGDVDFETIIDHHLTWFFGTGSIQPISLGNIKAMFK